METYRRRPHHLTVLSALSLVGAVSKWPAQLAAEVLPRHARDTHDPPKNAPRGSGARPPGKRLRRARGPGSYAEAAAAKMARVHEEIAQGLRDRHGNKITTGLRG